MFVIIWLIVLSFIKLKPVLNSDFQSPSKLYSNNLFYLISNDTFFLMKPSHSSKLNIVTLNQPETSKYLVKVRTTSLHSFILPINENKYKVIIYSKQMNSFLTNLPLQININFLCKFFYPISTAGRNELHQCSITFRSKLSREILLGSCKLELLATSCFCVITGVINIDQLEKRDVIVATGSVSSCSDGSCAEKAGSWIELTKSISHVPLTSWDSLVWITSFYDKTYKLGLLIGVPRYSVEENTVVDVPLRLLSSGLGKNAPSNIEIMIKYNHDVQIDSLDTTENNDNFKFLNSPSYSTDNNDWSSVFVLGTSEKFQNRRAESSEILVIVKINVKSIISPLKISARIDQIVLRGNTIDQIRLDSTEIQATAIIPIIAKSSLITAFESPLIAPKLKKNQEPYQLKIEMLKTYFVYDSAIMEMTDKMTCRTFNASVLKCPPNMKSTLNSDWKFIHNHQSLEWAVELNQDEVRVILDMRPQVVTEDLWEIGMSDYVVKRISYWRGPHLRSTSGLLTDASCEHIYQVVPIKIFQKAMFYNQVIQMRTSVMIDVTNQTNLKNLRLDPNFANLYRYGNLILLQGLRESNLKLELTDKESKNLSTKNIRVFDETVQITDMEVNCVSLVNVLPKSLYFSFSVNFHELEFKFQEFNSSSNCLIVIDLVFSDFSKTNIFMFPREQFFLKFVTNTEIMEIFDLKDMFYNYQRFNNETSFYIELFESKSCYDPKSIFKKFVKLYPNNLATPPLKTSIPTRKITTTTTPAFQNVKQKSADADSPAIHNLIYILCAIVGVALLILILNFVIRYAIKKRSSEHLLLRRKSFVNDNITLQEKTPDHDYPPLLPPPGEPVGLIDNMTVALSSPHSFWCLNPNDTLSNKKSQPFNRQFSLPVKGCPAKDQGQPCPPLRWMHKFQPEDIKMNVYSSQEDLIHSPVSLPVAGSPMCWSVTQMEGDISSGIGSLMTNMDDLLKDPYEAKDRFSRLSELPCVLIDRKETVYEAI